MRGRDNTRVGLRAFVYEGNSEVWSQGIRLQGETTFRGVVGDDAKLEFMEPHNTETATIALGGSSRGFEPITMRTLIQRITRVNMKTGEYVLGPSIINVSISSRGLGGLRAAGGGAAGRREHARTGRPAVPRHHR